MKNEISKNKRMIAEELIKALPSGKIYFEEVEILAKKRGINVVTLYQAKKNLNVASYRIGYPGGKSVWVIDHFDKAPAAPLTD